MIIIYCIKVTQWRIKKCSGGEKGMPLPKKSLVKMESCQNFLHTLMWYLNLLVNEKQYVPYRWA